MTKKKKMRLILLAAAILLIAAILWVSLRKEPEKALLKVMADRVDLQVRNVRYTEVGDSGMRWEIVAESATYQKKENLAFFEKFTVRLVLKDGSLFVMTGDKGQLNTESRDLKIEGNVVILSPRGDRFTTDHLQYWNAKQVVETEGAVLVENKTSRLQGVGMVYSLAEKHVAILSQVRATTQVK
ncbi:MAG: LPS export ABC transporter periplasmic protein LptC [Deltaproteobacteria bacterium]|nr:LPS export ABC transporter periplasmic protein LptC [Deltaproteobacteria bacterium]